LSKVRDYVCCGKELKRGIWNQGWKTMEIKVVTENLIQMKTEVSIGFVNKAYVIKPWVTQWVGIARNFAKDATKVLRFNSSLHRVQTELVRKSCMEIRRAEMRGGADLYIRKL